MKITAGSKNNAKLQAVQRVFPDEKVVSMDAASHVSAQPFSDEETMQGAINRAKQCADHTPDGMGIGLEGGVMYVGDRLFLCNWGALAVHNGDIFTASGARLALPQEFNEPLENGAELGDVMDAYTKKNAVRQKEGAIGIFTNEHVARSDMFMHIVQLLRGQWEFWR